MRQDITEKQRLKGVDIPREIAICLAFSIAGFAFARHVVGWRVLNPLDDSWFSGDPSTGYMGWLFFRKEEHLSFPFGWATGIGYPLGEPIAYLDSIPLAALVFWPFRHVLPETFQYHGIVFALSCILQLYFGYRLTLRFARSINKPDDDVLNQACAVLGGILFMMAPSFVFRSFGHFALLNHWLILAAMDFFLSMTGKATARQILASSALCLVAGAINPYIAAMVLIVIGAAYARALFDWQGPRAVALSCAGFGISVACAGTALFLFGFIVPGDPDIYAAAGYGLYSMNLLSPIDPHVWPSILLKARNIGPGQYEGYNYLGLGMLLLGLVTLSYRPGLLLKPFRLTYIPGWLIIIGCLLLALSLKATFGTAVIYDIKVPERVFKLLSALRVSGRLFWPAYYLIMICIIGAATLAYGRWAVIPLALAVVIQFLDVRTLQTAVYDQWRASSSTSLTDPAWQDIGRNHRHLVLAPAWPCDQSKTPGGLQGYWTFGKLAAQQNMTTNSFYAGRTSPKQLEFFCIRQPAQTQKDGMQKDSAYIFSSSTVDLPPANDHVCRQADGLTLCTQRDDKSSR